MDPHRRKDRDIAVRKKEDVARVLENRRNITGDKTFILAKSNDRRRTETGRNNLVRVSRGKNCKGIDSGELLDALAHCVFERPTVQILFNQMRDNFRVSFCFELMPFHSKLMFQQICFTGSSAFTTLLFGFVLEER